MGFRIAGKVAGVCIGPLRACRSLGPMYVHLFVASRAVWAPVSVCNCRLINRLIYYFASCSDFVAPMIYLDKSTAKILQAMARCSDVVINHDYSSFRGVQCLFLFPFN